MRYIRFVMTNKKSVGLNWKRFIAGMLLAMSSLLLVGGGAALVAAQTFKKPGVSLFPSRGDDTGKGTTILSPTMTIIANQQITETDTLTMTTVGNGTNIAYTQVVVSPQPEEPTPTPIPWDSVGNATPTSYPIPLLASPTVVVMIATTLPEPTATATPQPTPIATSSAPVPVQNGTYTTTATVGQSNTPLLLATVTQLTTIDTAVTNTAAATAIPTLTPNVTNTPTTAATTAVTTATPTLTPNVTNTPTTATTVTTDTPTPTSNATNTPTLSSPLATPTFEEITLFGVEINKGYVQQSIDKLDDTSVSWVRYNGIEWNEVEATEGSIDWSKLAQVEEDLLLLREHGFEPMVIIRGTPTWAQQTSASCGPITTDKLPAFATFMQKVVERYSVAPYTIHYWEIGNEPDVDPALVPPNMPFGCWGNAADPYYGGSYYGQMLQTIAPVMRAADPRTRIVLGGLLLDCDYNSPPEGKDCSPAKFFEGVLRQGAADSFDVVGYHSYAFWGLDDEDWDVQQAFWKHRGGALLGKAQFLREVMQQYNVSKPLLPNETGLLCWENDPICVQEGYLEDQQNYLVRTYVRAWANTLLGASWYTFNHSGWHDAGLLNPDTTPRPASYTLKFFAKTLDGATFQERVSLASTAQEGYIFRKGTIEYHIYWSNDSMTFSVALPTGTVAAYAFGTGADSSTAGYAPVDITGQTTLSVGFAPIMLEVHQ